MDPISGSNSSNINRAYGASEVRANNSSAKPTSAEASKVSLTDLGELAVRVDQSAKDVRPEVRTFVRESVRRTTKSRQKLKNSNTKLKKPIS